MYGEILDGGLLGDILIFAAFWRLFLYIQLYQRRRFSVYLR
jgi:hypothetical protein